MGFAARGRHSGGMPDPVSPLDPALASVLTTPVGTIRYWQRYPDGYAETRTAKDGNAGRTRLVVAWEDAENFRQYALGFTQGPATPGGTGLAGYTFLRALPLFWPRGRRVMRCDTLDHVGQMNSPGFAHFPETAADGWFRTDYVELDATFTERHLVASRTDAALASYFAGNPNEPVSELPRYVERRWRTTPKEREVPSFGYETYNPGDLAAEGTAIRETGFVPFVETEWVYVWHQVPVEWYPKDAINALYLKVNKAPTPDPGSPANRFDRKFPPGTLRFNGLAEELTPYSGADENLYVDVAYSFTEQPKGWNTTPPFDPTLTTWPPIRRIGTNPPVPLYAEADLWPLFRPNPTKLDPW